MEMTQSLGPCASRSFRRFAWLSLFVLAIICMATMAALINPAFAAGARATPGQQTFASPEQAADALAAAWRHERTADLLKIFGEAGIRLVSSGDAVADRNARERLASAYDAQHRFERIGEGAAQLIIGAEEFPYPIPLVKQGSRWRFDAAAGAEEILDRRIGRNELNAIEVCLAYVEAQREYAAKDASGAGLHEYAMKIASADGKRDGLYWPATTGEAESPFGPLIASAADEGYGAGSEDVLSPYHGYYYRILTRQGSNAPGGTLDYVVKGHMVKGFAMVAFPAKYGNSGVMTFIVNQDGIVFEKNLGPDTARIAREMTQYDPDSTWKVHAQ